MVVLLGASLLGITVSGIWYRSQRSQIVDPVQMRLLRDGVHPAEQQVHRVGTPRSQAPGQLASHKVGDRNRAQFGIVSHRV